MMESKDSINKNSNTSQIENFVDNTVNDCFKFHAYSHLKKQPSVEEIDDEQYDIDSLGRSKVRNRRYSIVDTIDNGPHSPARRHSTVPSALDSFRQQYAQRLQENDEELDQKLNSCESLDESVVDLDSLGNSKVHNRRYSIFDTIKDGNKQNLEKRRVSFDFSQRHRMRSESNSDKGYDYSRRSSSCYSFRRDSLYESPREARVLPIKRLSIASMDSNASSSEKSDKTAEVADDIDKESESKGEITGDDLDDEEIMHLVNIEKLSISKLESFIGDLDRAVRIRREIIGEQTDYLGIEKVPFEDYDYSQIFECCCENTIGYVPIPIGVIGPLLLNDKMYRIPLATIEGCLVASANRGCRVLRQAGGVKSFVTGDSMTRGPVTQFPSAERAVAAYEWLAEDRNFNEIKKAFDTTSRYARLQSIKARVVGRNLFIRFAAKTGNAMGMNMVSKGTEAAINKLSEYFPDIQMSCLSGNFCTDKKSSIENWIEGRGKSVVAEAWIPEHLVIDTLKTSIEELVNLNTTKNLIGSTIAGTIGGFNAHAANIVAAIFIATGQDPAQVVCSSNCITIMEKCNKFGDCLYISCSMPSLEVGTVGGGTHLTPQRGCLELLRLDDNSAEELSQVICSAVMAGELSLLSALSAGDLIKSHMKLNRLKK